ncbi:MAG: cytochrome c [Immundisolibacteraceae bacterium]|nr:cytochrome c [Immundisolibacteraceae bacterium]
MNRISSFFARLSLLLLTSGSLLAGGANPSTPGSPAVASGSQLYQQFCQRCHGTQMRNSGASTFDLRQFPSDEYERFVESVSEGYEDMPAHGDILNNSEIDALFGYMVTIQQAQQQGSTL